MSEQELHLSCIQDAGSVAGDAMKIGWAIDHLKKAINEGQAGQVRFELKADRQFRDDNGNSRTETVLYSTNIVEPDDGDQSKIVELIIAMLAEHKAQIETDLKSRLALAGLKLAEERTE